METTAISLPFIELLKLALGTGLVAGIATQSFGWIIDRWKSNRLAETQATYLAVRLAVAFESFAIRCAEKISDNDMFRQSEGHAGRPHGTLPNLEEFPADVSWTTLDPALLSRSLSIPNELLLGERMIAFWSDVDPDPSLTRSACDAQAATCGYRAWKLAENLRTRYKLPEFVPKDFSWDTIRGLKKRHDREIARIREEQSRESPSE